MRLAPEVVTSIQTMAKDNALWGAERIRGELLKLGICVSKRTIQKYMRHVRPSGSRGQTWRTFIRNHSGDIWACDFLQLYDIFFRPIFAFFFVVHGTREVIRCNVTRCPTDALVAQQLREATPYCSGPRYLIRDNDDKSHHLDNRVHARITPPSGYVALAIVPPPYHLLVEGAVLGNNVVLVTDAETDFVVPGEAHCDTLVVPKRLYEESSRTLFPGLSTNGDQACLMPLPHSGWSVLQAETRNLLRDGNVTAEDISHLLCRFFDLMAGESGETVGDACFGNRSTSRIAWLAQEYIEDHYRGTIRMEDLCRFTGVSLRTLQRSFLVYFQVSPCDYIKARRLSIGRIKTIFPDFPMYPQRARQRRDRLWVGIST